MRACILTFCLFAYCSSQVHALNRRAPADITNNVLHLRAAPYAHNGMPPSSRHLAAQRLELSPDQAAIAKRQLGDAQEDLITLGGRVYITDVTLGDDPFQLVIDTGSSDTWVTASYFSCLNPVDMSPVDADECGFNTSYDPSTSPTWAEIPNVSFSVNYTGGEFLIGDLGTEQLGIGNVGNGGPPVLKVKQTIGVVESGYWVGDGISSGLMGLAYPSLVSNARTLRYNSVMITLTRADTIAPIFSLALSRPSVDDPQGGGYLAIGGIPDVTFDPDFVTVPTVPIFSNTYAWYSLTIDGFEITLPASASPRQKMPPPSHPRTASAVYIIDSGSSLMYLPDAIVDYIAASFVPRARFSYDSGMWIVLCGAAAPRVGIVIAGRTFYISENDLMNRDADAVGGPGMGAGAGKCVMGAQRAGGGSLVLGDVWLKNVLVVFDLKGNRIRVAGREVY